MYYRIVEIKPANNGTEWECSITDDWRPVVDSEEPSKTFPKPNGNGFMYFPCTMDGGTAFETLKSHLVREHEKRIADLQESLNLLKRTELPRYNVVSPCMVAQMVGYPDSDATPIVASWVLDKVNNCKTLDAETVAHVNGVLEWAFEGHPKHPLFLTWKEAYNKRHA